MGEQVLTEEVMRPMDGLVAAGNVLATVRTAWWTPDIQTLHRGLLDAGAQLGRRGGFWVETRPAGVDVILQYASGTFLGAYAAGADGEFMDVGGMVSRWLPIPLSLPATGMVLVVGRIHIPRTQMQHLQEYLAERGVEKCTDAASYARGMLEEGAEAGVGAFLDFFAEDVIGDGRPFSEMTRSGVREWLADATFDVAEGEDCRHCSTIADVLDIVAKTSVADGQRYDIASLRIVAQCRKPIAGCNGGVLWPLHSEVSEAVVSSIDFTTRASGEVVPRLQFVHPVTVGSAVVRSHTLADAEDITALGLRPGDVLALRMDPEQGGVIVTRVVSRSFRDAVPFPVACPSCGAILERKSGSRTILCSGGFACSVQARPRLRRLLSRTLRGVCTGSVGDAADALHRVGLLRNAADMFRLHRHPAQLKAAVRWSDAALFRMLTLIDGQRKMSLARYFELLAVPRLERDVAEAVAETIGSLPRFLQILDTDWSLLGPFMATWSATSDALNQLIVWSSDDRNVEFARALAREVVVG